MNWFPGAASRHPASVVSVWCGRHFIRHESGPERLSHPPHPDAVSAPILFAVATLGFPATYMSQEVANQLLDIVTRSAVAALYLANDCTRPSQSIEVIQIGFLWKVANATVFAGCTEYSGSYNTRWGQRLSPTESLWECQVRESRAPMKATQLGI